MLQDLQDGPGSRLRPGLERREIERDGVATITLRVRWRVLAGRFRAFELAENCCGSVGL